MALSETTLGTLFLHPARQAYDISDTPVTAISKAVEAYMKAHTDVNKATPEIAAISFYAFCQMIGHLTSVYDRSEPMEEQDAEVLLRYLKFMDTEAKRAAMYLLIICIRECRHAHASATVDKKIAIECSQAAVDWIRKYKSGENYTSLWTHPPDCTFGQLVTAVRRVFYEVPFTNGYGGKAWGAIADCIESFVYGRSSTEVMMDTNWTLSHNNGPIFNKGMLYYDYSGRLVQILDVQRAGMLMQGILEEHPLLAGMYTPHMKELIASFVDRHPTCVDKDYVDWFQVEELGAIHKFPSYQKEQEKKYGPSPYKTASSSSNLVGFKQNVAPAPDLANYYTVDVGTNGIALPIVTKHRAPKVTQIHDSIMIEVPAGASDHLSKWVKELKNHPKMVTADDYFDWAIKINSGFPPPKQAPSPPVVSKVKLLIKKPK